MIDYTHGIGIYLYIHPPRYTSKTILENQNLRIKIRFQGKANFPLYSIFTLFKNVVGYKLLLICLKWRGKGFIFQRNKQHNFFSAVVRLWDKSFNGDSGPSEHIMGKYRRHRRRWGHVSHPTSGPCLIQEWSSLYRFCT